jgi:hypothetical protein
MLKTFFNLKIRRSKISSCMYICTCRMYVNILFLTGWNYSRKIYIFRETFNV